MRPFKFATITFPWVDSDGVYHPTKVCYSDASTPVAHTTAKLMYDHDTPMDGVTLIYVNGFENVDEAMQYCSERSLVVV